MAVHTRKQFEDMSESEGYSNVISSEDTSGSEETESLSSFSEVSSTDQYPIVFFRNDTTFNLELAQGVTTLSRIPGSKAVRFEFENGFAYDCNGGRALFRLQGEQKTGLHLLCESDIPNCVVKVLHGEEYDTLVPVFTVLLQSTEARHAAETSKIDERLKKRLIKQTYFDGLEISQLFTAYHSFAHPKDVVDKESFVRLFPELDDKLVIDSLFHALDKLEKKDDTISFEEVVVGLSIMCRGDQKDKAELAYDICDLNGDGNVSRKEVLGLANTMSRIMSSVGMHPSDYGDPEETINNVFVNRGGTVGQARSSTPDKTRRKLMHPITRYVVDEEDASVVTQAIKDSSGLYDPFLTKKEFMDRALHEPDLLDCFGLFDFFHWRLLEPHEVEMRKSLNISLGAHLEGHLHIKKVGIFPLFGKTYWCEIKNGFLGIFKHQKSAEPKRAYPLWDVRIKASHKDDCAFRILTAEHVFDVRASSSSDTLIWMTAMKAHRRMRSRYKSFAPGRSQIHCRWFVNAEEYFRQLLTVFRGAKSRIFIAAWAIAPQLYLHRGKPLDDNDRLDNVLVDAAKRGVKVYLLIYDAPTMLDLRAQWVYKLLNSSNNNISVIRHPKSLMYYLWSHHQKAVVVDETVAFVGGIDLAFFRFDNRKFNVVDADEIYFPGRDYGNLNIHPETNGPALESIIDRKLFPRMPWHDVSVQVDGDAAMDVAMNFLQRWNFSLSTGHHLSRARAILPLKYFAYGTPTLPAASVHDRPQAATFPHIHMSREELGPSCKVQLVRSCGTWAGGTAMPERSIYKAYVRMIEESEHFILIENQFFISSIDRASPKNRVLLALFNRISRAIEQQQIFRVMIVIPQVPGGDLNEGSNKFIFKYTYRSINRGGSSLLEKLQTKFPDVDLSEYVYFFTLRNWGKSDSKLLHENVYIHAKVMICDDRKVIVGSANINDRSMLGTRDTEIAAVIEGLDHPSVMAGESFQVCRFAHALRMEIWRDALGVDIDEDEDLHDPVGPAAWHRLIRTANSNTKIYLDVFGKMPDTAHTLREHERTDIDMNEKPDALAKLEKVQGMVVNFALDFLKLESMNVPTFSKEKVVPRVVFL